MPNEPEPARKKRTPPATRQNAQDDHEGAPHDPEEFLRDTPPAVRPGHLPSDRT